MSITLLVDPRALCPAFYTQDHSGLESFYQLLELCLNAPNKDMGITVSTYHEALDLLEDEDFFTQPHLIHEYFNDAALPYRDLIKFVLSVKNALIDNYLTEDADKTFQFKYQYKSPGIIPNLPIGFSELRPELTKATNQTILFGWVLNQEKLVPSNNQFLATHDDQSPTITANARSFNYQNKYTKQRSQYVSHSIQTVRDIPTFLKKVGWENLWSSSTSWEAKCAALNLYLHSAISSTHRNWTFNSAFWDSLKQFNVWNNATLANKLARICADEINYRDTDGDELHQIKDGGPNQLRSGSWGAWQRDLSGNQLRLQLWRNGNNVQFAAVSKAHTYKPPHPN